MALITQTIDFLSSDGHTTAKAALWQDDEVTPRAVLQIAHGMSEYIARYEPFAAFMTRQGYIVCGNDYLGHGETAPSPEYLGYIPPQGGAEFLVEDIHALYRFMHQRYPSLAYFLFGHSMGSIITRAYITKYGSELTGYICSGTVGPNPALAVAIPLARREVRRKDPFARSNFLDRMAFGRYNKRCENPRTKFDWLTRDTAVVDHYIAHPWCGFTFTAAGFLALLTLSDEISKPGWVRRVPKTLPILMVTGEYDPVGSYTKGPKTVCRRLRDAGLEDITFTIYPQCRHELHNELNRQQVYRDYLNWMDDRIPR